MKIAFYAPMKDPGHDVPSGDREMARLFIRALKYAGHDVQIASAFRTYDNGNEARQAHLARIGERLAKRLLRRFQALPPKDRPDVWFTYHLYHKAPDWLGPVICKDMNLPYVVAEGASSSKQAGGAWDFGYKSVARALSGADLVLGLNPKDADGVIPLLRDPGLYHSFLPFIDAERFLNARISRQESLSQRRGEVGRGNGEPGLLTVAMMRDDQKLDSYRVLANALSKLIDRPWKLMIVGDGPARDKVSASFAALSSRVEWLGERSGNDLASIYAAADIFVWPAIREAFGMVPMEAAASGLPIVAGEGAGIAQIVKTGANGFLVRQGDPNAFAKALDDLLKDPARIALMGKTGMEMVTKDHDLPVAARRLNTLLEPLINRTSTE